ncbi:MAG: cytochrome c oxidase subunit II [Chitinophagaceae bacterium]|jgi:cytochrome c oxidase subunit 2|nr:cytochrome c oxidase subunit II [Chitinophagaceae bacterium]
MSGYFILIILVLASVLIFQISKASEYVSVLKGEEKSFKQSNRINAFLFILFMVLGLAGAWWCNELLYDRTLLAQPAASDHGEKIDFMLWMTIIVTGIVFLLTQVLLFWFAFKYQYSEKRTSYFFPHNNKLELLWTVVPAIFLTVLVGFGLFYWFKITGDAPKDAQIVEITGKQFNWMMRYPGKDNVLGRKNYRLTDASSGNALGVDWEDGASHDDVEASEMHLVVGKPVQLVINAQDVIHDVGLVHFRLKMDAVPGIPTTLWFTPKYTTEQMKKITGNKDFVYEISCDQICGSGHYSMRGVIVVETQEEYDAWMSSKKPQYITVKEGAAPAAPAADSTAAAVTATMSKPLAQLK